MRSYNRIKVPRQKDELLMLAEQVLKIYKENPDTVSLGSLLDMDTFEQLVLNARQEADNAERLRKEAEKATQLRDNYLGIGKGKKLSDVNMVLFFVTAIRNVLMGVNLGQEQVLGDYGFVVDRTRRRKKQDDKT